MVFEFPIEVLDGNLFIEGMNIGFINEMKEQNEEDWTDEEIELYHRTGDVPVEGEL